MKNFNAFASSIVFCIVFPLLPLLIAWQFGHPTRADVLLTAAIYPIGLFVQSKLSGLFAIGMLLSVFFSILVAMPATDGEVETIAYDCIAVMSLMHLAERIDLHLVKKQKFFNFSN